MKKNASIMFAGLLVILLSTTAWADLDPRANFGSCGFSNTEETWEPDAGGTLMQRVTYVSECDIPGVGDETITITTEDWNGSALVVTEVREAVRTESADIYFTTTMIYDGSMAPTGMEEHTYNYRTTSNPDIWFQDWTYYNWNGSSFVVTGYTTRETEWFTGGESEATYVFYDTTYREDPVIPDDVPVLGSSTASPILPPLDKHIDLGDTYANLGRMYERVRNVLLVNLNTQAEGNARLQGSGDPVSHLCTPPPGVYVAAVLKADRLDDPGIFNGYFARWIKWLNTVPGDLNVQFGWTSDRDLNEPTEDWWQARVLQLPSGAIEFIENAHRVGDTYEDHYDTFTLLNSMFMIESQTIKLFNFIDVYPGDFTESTTVTDGMGAPASYSVWTVVYD